MFISKERLIEIINDTAISVFGKRIDTTIENVVGRKAQSEGGYYYMSQENGYITTRYKEIEKKPATGLFKQIADLEKKVALLEEYLKINVVKEVKEFEGYKAIAAPKKSAVKKVTKRKR